MAEELPQVDEDLREIYLESRRFEVAMEAKMWEIENFKAQAMAGSNEERQNIQQLEQQLVSWQSIHVIINIGILKCEKFSKVIFYFHVCFKSKFSFITH